MPQDGIMEVIMKAFNKIPDILRKITGNIKRFYSRHLIGKLFATGAGILILAGLIHYIPIFMVKADALPEVNYDGLSEPGAQIPKDAGEVMVAESGSKSLYIDSATMNLKIRDKNTGKTWNALVPGAAGTLEQSLLTVSYLGNDNNLYEWDSYTYSTALGSYSIFQIENGVQIRMDINEGESERFSEYYPVKMPPERYEDFFLAGIKNLVDTGQLDQETADKYQTTLGLIYKKSIMENVYAVAINGTPPRSAVRQLIALAKLLGYTQEMLLEDSTELGLTVAFVEPAAFDITVEATLEGDDFVFRVPTQEMVSRNPFYTIQNIKVLPGFGTAKAEEYEDGYILVPDGAGALFEFNTYDPAVPDYKRPVYDNDYFTDYYFMPEYSDELMMPVFGMTYGEGDSATHGFLGIIEQGAETSYIHVKLGSVSKESPSAYNKAYASFDVTQYTSVKVYGPFSENAASYQARSGPLKVDYTIRYRLFPDTVTYYDMAKSYQDYLMRQWQISEPSYPEQAKLYLDFIGAISLTGRILGIPYDSRYSMTTYKELADIIGDLDDVNAALQYTGFFNGGFENELYDGAEPVKANGSKGSLAQLRQLADGLDMDLFFDTALSKIYDEGNGFSARTHAIYDYSNNPAEIYRYSPAIGIFNGWFNFWESYHYSLLSPRYLNGVVDRFLKEAKDYEKLSISDLAYYNYSDYRFKKTISTYEAAQVVDHNLKKLAEGRELSLYNPQMKNLVYGTYAKDISRSSSDYATLYSTIPFRQLVMNGLIQVTTEDVNLSSNNDSYYVLQAVELGVYPKFTLTARSTDVLKDSSYNYLYATQYEKQKDKLRSVYDRCRAAWDSIGAMEITDHTILQENVFRTDYASGAWVITNYNLHSVTVDNQEIAALGYRIIKE